VVYKTYNKVVKGKQAIPLEDFVSSIYSPIELTSIIMFTKNFMNL